MCHILVPTNLHPRRPHLQNCLPFAGKLPAGQCVEVEGTSAASAITCQFHQPNIVPAVDLPALLRPIPAIRVAPSSSLRLPLLSTG